MLGLEDETAFNQLPTSEQEYMTYQVANNIKHYNTFLDKKEKNILKQMKEKLLSNDVIISKAAKGKCVVNTYQNTHHEKIMEFFNNKNNNNNNFINIKGDLLKKFQK